MDYQLLPFRFERFNDTEYLLTNEVGEYIFLQNEDFHRFVDGEMDVHSDLFYDIESKQIATTDKVEDVVSMLATKFRTKKSILRDFTSLHMVVPIYTWLFRPCVAIPVVYIVKSHVKIGMTILLT